MVVDEVRIADIVHNKIFAVFFERRVLVDDFDAISAGGGYGLFDPKLLFVSLLSDGFETIEIIL